MLSFFGAIDRLYGTRRYFLENLLRVCSCIQLSCENLEASLELNALWNPDMLHLFHDHLCSSDPELICWVLGFIHEYVEKGTKARRCKSTCISCFYRYLPLNGYIDWISFDIDGFLDIHRRAIGQIQNLPRLLLTLLGRHEPSVQRIILRIFKFLCFRERRSMLGARCWVFDVA
jgi:hypothetical protein